METREREREREIGIGKRERVCMCERGRREREREKRLRYRRTRSPQDVIAEQTEGPRTISINKIYAPRTQSASSSFYRSSSASGLPHTVGLSSLLSHYSRSFSPLPHFHASLLRVLSNVEMEGEGDRRAEKEKDERERRENAKRSRAILLPSSRACGAREKLTRAQLPFLGR